MAGSPVTTTPGSPNHQKSSLHLLDLIHSLSSEGFEASIWSRLDTPSRGTFNLTCRKSRELVDQLVTSATLRRLSRAGPGAACATPTQFAAFLKRLPRLTCLHLHRTWPTEVDLVGLLKHCGAATNGRVLQATLFDNRQHSGTLWQPQLFYGGLHALSQACPRLRELALVGPSDGSALQLQSALFMPFHDGELVQLTTTSCSLSRDVVASLESVTTLTSLRALRCTNTNPWHFQMLGRLPLLQHCEFELDDLRCSLSDLAPLFDATRLTLLRLGGEMTKETWYPSSTQPPDADADALARLGNLACLQSLDLGRRFVVDDAAMAALGRLTQLTRLCVGALQLEAPLAGGHLQHLQALELGDEDDPVTPSLLLGSLLPLLPLASLATLGYVTLCLDVGVYGDDADSSESDNDDEDVAVATAEATEGAALRSAAQHLAAAPVLTPPRVVHMQVRQGQRHLSLGQIADGLQPLAAHLHTLALWGCDLAAADWGMVHQRLPNLTTLWLDDQNSDSVDLAAVVRHLTKLGELVLCFRLGGCTVDVEMWRRLAEECSRPLRLSGRYWVAVEVQAGCRQVQAQLHGAQNIQWL